MCVHYNQRLGAQGLETLVVICFSQFLHEFAHVIKMIKNGSEKHFLAKVHPQF